jgi:hypothetical protein
MLTSGRWVLICSCAHPLPAGWPQAQPYGGYFCVRCNGWRNAR